MIQDNEDQWNASAPVTVVFGASGGIGSAVAEQLVEEGHQVIAVARSREKLSQLTEAIGSEHHIVKLQADALQPDDVSRVFKETIEQFGRVDGVANCVGSILLKPAHLTSLDEFNSVVQTNLTSAFLTVSNAAKHMKQGGSVVLVSSVAAKVGLANHEAIAAAKAGIIGLAQSAAATYARKDLRFNAVAPALVRTPMTARITENPTALEASRAMHPLGRIGEPGDIASAITWLLDPCNSWVTGQVIGLDGGMASLRAGAKK